MEACFSPVEETVHHRLEVVLTKEIADAYFKRTAWMTRDVDQESNDISPQKDAATATEAWRD